MFRLKRSKGTSPVPTDGLAHVAFIMDGNGRWAKKRGLPRELGHRAGAKNFRTVVDRCFSLGIDCVTVYAFSTENWRRPPEEVDEIMRLLSAYIDDAFADFSDRDIEIVFIGRMDGLSKELLDKADRLERESAGRKRRLNIALNYGGRDEIVRAANRLVAEGCTALTEELLSSAMDTAPCPEPDLIVRTGGDLRTSNFLLWQSAYAEYCFTPTLWPDLSVQEVDAILRDYSHRHRRFGGL